MELSRFISVYFVQGSLIVFLLALFRKLQKRNPSIHATFLKITYLTVSIGLFINCIYAPLTNESIVIFLDFLMNYLIQVAQIFPFLFTYSLYYGYALKKSVIKKILVIQALLLFLGMFIPLLINPDFYYVTETFSPRWTLMYGIIIIIMYASVIVIPSMMYFFKVKKKLKDNELKKRYNVFYIGYFSLLLSFFGTVLYLSVFEGLLQLLWSVITLISVPVGGYLMYLGMGKELKTRE